MPLDKITSLNFKFKNPQICGNVDRSWDFMLSMQMLVSVQIISHSSKFTLGRWGNFY